MPCFITIITSISFINTLIFIVVYISANFTAAMLGLRLCEPLPMPLRLVDGSSSFSRLRHPSDRRLGKTSAASRAPLTLDVVEWLRLHHHVVDFPCRHLSSCQSYHFFKIRRYLFFHESVKHRSLVKSKNKSISETYFQLAAEFTAYR